VDLIKVQWNADAAGDGGVSEFAQTVQKSGPSRVILCRCDNKQAVEYGHSMGISLFQGRYLDSLVNPSQKSEN
jgi:hypothetical protein